MTEDRTELLLTAYDTVADDAEDLARAIYDHPELSLEEVEAHDHTAEVLRRGGFSVTSVKGLPTALVATLDSCKPGVEIGLLAEYDALPDIGHGCGHHLIAGSAVAAGLALRSVLSEVGGLVKVFGCPAEEIGTGKVAMLAAGAFSAIDAALTFHAYHSSSVMVSCNGLRQLAMKFEGTASHAAEEPWDGSSALDGVVLTFQNIAALRQFLRDGSRIHGIITDGGQAVNIIPERAACVIAMRSTDPDELEHIRSRVVKCAEAAADASGTTFRVDEVAHTAPVRRNPQVDSVVRRAFERVGESVGSWEALASTDFGNVSQQVPSALFSVRTWPKGVAFHSREATHYGGLPEAYQAMRLGGKVMALAAAELLAHPGTLDRAGDR